MEVVHQVRLLLRRNLALHLRQPVILTLELLWPVAVFLIVMAARNAVPPVPQPTCHYKAWALPSAGVVPFVQSLICNIDDCQNETEYEAIPSYKGSSVRELVSNTLPLITDQSITELVTALPKGMRLMRVAVDALSGPDLSALLDDGFPIRNLLKNASQTRELLQHINMTTDEVDLILDSSIQLPQILEIMSQNNFCDTSQESDPYSSEAYNILQQKVCTLDNPSRKDFFRQLKSRLDIKNIVKTMGIAMSELGRLDISEILGNIGGLLSSLQTSNILHEDLLTMVTTLLEEVQFDQIDTKVISHLIEDLEPLYRDSEWSSLIYLLKDLELPILKGKSSDGQNNGRKSDTMRKGKIFPNEYEMGFSETSEDETVSFDVKNQTTPSILQTVLGFIETGMDVLRFMPQQTSSQITEALNYIIFLIDLIDDVENSLKNSNSEAFVNNLSDILGALLLTVTDGAKTDDQHSTKSQNLNFCNMKEFQEKINSSEMHDVHQLQEYACRISELYQKMRNSSEKPKMETWRAAIDKLHQIFNERKYSDIQKNILKWGTERIYKENVEPTTTMFTNESVDDLVSVMECGAQKIKELFIPLNSASLDTAATLNLTGTPKNISVMEASGLSKEKLIIYAISRAKEIINYIKSNPLFTNFIKFFKNSDTGSILTEIDKLTKVVGEEGFNRLPGTFSEVLRVLPALIFATKDFKLNSARPLTDFYGLPSVTSAFIQDLEPFIWESISPKMVQEFSKQNFSDNFCVDTNALEATQLHWKWMLCKESSPAFRISLPSKIKPNQKDSRLPVNLDIKSYEMFDARAFSRLFLQLSSEAGFILNIVLQFLKPINGCDATCNDEIMLKKICFLSRLQNIKNSLGAPKETTFEEGISDDYYNIAKQLQSIFPVDEGIIQSYDAFLDATRFSALSNHMDWKDVVRLLTSALRFLDSMDGKDHKLRPIFHVITSLSSLLKNRVSDAAQSAIMPMVQIQNVFPDSPLTQEVVKSFLPLLPDVISTFFWTSLAPGKLLDLVKHSEKNISVIMSELCDSSLTEYLYNPGLKGDEFIKLGEALCQHEYYDVFEEIFQDPDIQEIVFEASSTDDVAWEDMHNNILETVTLLIDLAKDKRADLSLLPPMTKWQKMAEDIQAQAKDPSVILFILNNKLFYGFCNMTTQHASKNLQNMLEAIKEKVIHRELCALSEPSFANQLVTEVNKSIADDISEGKGSDYVTIMGNVLKAMMKVPQIREIIYLGFGFDPTSGTKENEELSPIESGEEFRGFKKTNREKILKVIEKTFNFVDNMTDGELSSVLLGGTIPEIMKAFSTFIVNSDGEINLKNLFRNNEQVNKLLQAFFQNQPEKERLNSYINSLRSYFLKPENSEKLKSLCKTQVEKRVSNHSVNALSEMMCSEPPIKWSSQSLLKSQTNLTAIWIQVGEILSEDIQISTRDRDFRLRKSEIMSAIDDILMHGIHVTELPIVESSSFYFAMLRSIVKNLDESGKNNSLFGNICLSPSIKMVIQDSVHNLLESIPGAEFLSCELLNKNISSFYEWLSSSANLKNNIQKIADAANKEEEYERLWKFTLKVIDDLESFYKRISRNVSESEISNINQCLKNFKQSPLISSIEVQANILQKTATFLSSLGAPAGQWKEIKHDLLEKISQHLPAFFKISEIISDKTSLFSSDIDEVDKVLKKILPETKINLNWLLQHGFSPDQIRNTICKSYGFQSADNILLHPSTTTLNARSKMDEFLCRGNSVERLLSQMNHDEVKSKIRESQEQQFFSGEWLQMLIEKSDILVDVIVRLGSALSEVRIQNLYDIFQLFSKPHVIQNVVESFEKLMGVLQPVFPGSSLIETLHQIVDGMKAFKSLSQLANFSFLYNVTDVFGIDVKSILLKEFQIDPLLVEEFMKANIDLKQATMNPENGYVSFCTGFQDSSIRCLLSSYNKTRIFAEYLQDLVLQRFLFSFGTLGVEGVLKEAGVNANEAAKTLQILSNAPDVVSKLTNHLETVTTVLHPEVKELFESLGKGSDWLASPEALSIGGQILCGKPLTSLSRTFLPIVPDDTKNKIEEKELLRLPNEFCRHGYNEIMKTKGGAILWGFLKPLFRGKILFSPKSYPTANTVISKVNETFKILEEQVMFIKAAAEGSTGLHYLQRKNETLLSLQKFLSSKAVSKFLGSSWSAALSWLESPNTSSRSLLHLVELVGNVTQCISLDRFIGFETEAELELAAATLHDRREFIAAIVFMGDQENESTVKYRNYRSANNILPNNVMYKLRMDIDNVPTTEYIKYRWWRPYPYDNFFEDMRYFRGFIQLQDTLDTAIMDIQTESSTGRNVKKYLQQFPYPCHQSDKFGTLLKGSMPAVMTISWVFIVAFLVRERVLGRELELDETLRVMGLRQISGWLAWFLTGLSILMVTVIGIVAVLKWGGITPNSDVVVLFLFVADFAVLLIAYCQLMSTFFERASTAALLSVLLYVLSFFPFLLFITWELHFVHWQKLLSCALVSTSFCFGCLYLNRYEDQGQGVHWSNLWHSPVAEDKMNFGTTLVAMALCSLAYFLISWYVARISTGKKTRKPLSWYFLLTPKITNEKSAQNEIVKLDVQSRKSLEAGYKQTDVKKTVGISIKNVHAVYSKHDSKEWRALSGLNIELYEDQITALLGHNGAGKTTTIKILTGRLQPTSGSVTVCGLNIPEQLAEARKLIGFCPQNNTLYDKLTVKEHLYLFSQLKGLLDNQSVVKDVECMLEKLNLVEKQNECTETLSGGQRRRLCVGVALVGGSKVVILDEPTSSVDPVARRSIWDLILSYKKGRTILFTTHHLDEADILSDRVAILHKGRMLCSDSPLQLKVRFGSGYRLSIFPGSEKMERDERDSGRASSITETEELLNVDSDGVMEFIQTYVRDATLLENDDSHLVVSLPAEPLTTKPLSELFAHLQKCLHLWGFQSYSLSSATLEEVFLTLCRLEDAKAAHNSDKYNANSPFHIKKSNDTTFAFKSEDTNKCNDPPLPIEMKDCIDDNTPFSCFNLKYNQLKSLLKKRYWHTKRNWKALMSSIIMPCVFIALAMGLAVGRPQKVPDPSIKLTPSLYSSNHHKTVSFFSWEEPTPSLGNALLKTVGTNFSNSQICSSGNKNCEYSKVESLLMKTPFQRCLCESECPPNATVAPNSFLQTIDQIIFNMSDINIPQYLLDSNLQFNEKRYGGWTIERSNDSEDISKVWFENSGYHSAPSYLNTLNNAILKRVKGYDFDIQTWSHPLRLSVEQLGRETLLQRLGEVGIAFVFLIGLSLVPCTFAVYIVGERQSEQKRLQMVTGAVGPILYWSAALIWDLCIVLLTSAISAAIVGAFALPAFYQRQNFRAVYTLIFLYGWATTPLTYLCSGFFPEGSLAFMVIFTSHLFVGLVTMLALVTLRMVSITKDVASTLELLQQFSLAFPQYCLVGGLTHLEENQIRTEIFEQFGQDIYMSPFRWTSLGPNFVALFVQGIVFFVLTVLLEILPWKHWYQRLLFGKSHSCKDDIKTNDDPSKYLLQIQDISQVYHTKAGRRYAVDNLTLNIPEGECFGLVGANGAGKTTLFRLLIGEIQPTSGRILCVGLKSSRKHRFLGYCPQKDALDGLLTTREHLEVYAGLRGIPTMNVTKVVERCLHSFELDTHADRPVCTLSGGTRRKLCTAIATLGEPDLVLLDEPTSGMDPATRRLVWKSISYITEAGRSVILTSHSIEDCDVLCSRLGIMVNGSIACLNSPTKLKSRLGTGYTLSFRISENIHDWSSLITFIRKELPSAHLQIHSGRRIEMTLLDENVTLSNLFCQLEYCAKEFGIEDLAIDPTTLDQVFVNFVRQQSDAIHTNRESLEELYVIPKDKDLEICCTKL